MIEQQHLAVARRTCFSRSGRHTRPMLKCWILCFYFLFFAVMAFVFHFFITIYEFTEHAVYYYRAPSRSGRSNDALNLWKTEQTKRHVISVGEATLWETVLSVCEYTVPCNRIASFFHFQMPMFQYFFMLSEMFVIYLSCFFSSWKVLPFGRAWRL